MNFKSLKKFSDFNSKSDEERSQMSKVKEKNIRSKMNQQPKKGSYFDRFYLFIEKSTHFRFCFIAEEHYKRIDGMGFRIYRNFNIFCISRELKITSHGKIPMNYKNEQKNRH